MRFGDLITEHEWQESFKKTDELRCVAAHKQWEECIANIDTRQTMQDLADLEPDNTLLPVKEYAMAVNESVNRCLHYVHEDGKDFWQTPSTSYTIREGDCEDFAILKWWILNEGTDLLPQYLRIVAMKAIPNDWDDHMICVFRDPISGIWYALDNNFDYLARMDNFTFYKPVYSLSYDSKRKEPMYWTHREQG